MKEFVKQRLAGIITSAVALIATLVFLGILISSALLSVRLLVLCGSILLMLCLIVYELVKNSGERLRAAIGILLAAILIAAELMAGYYIATGAATLGKITGQKTEYAEFGVYVLRDDPAQSLADVGDYLFGILDPQDREATDQAIDRIEADIGKEIEYRIYSGVDELMDALIVKGEVDALLLNKGFTDLLDEIEGHENDMELLRELHSLQTETVTEIEEKDDSDSVFTVYISGIDTFGKISRKSRSDVNILATVNVETGQVLLVSTPRDYYVSLSISNGSPDKLTHAGIYGINVSLETMEMLYGIDIDYYFRVNFDGFKDIIDALGGITVNSQYSFTAGSYHFAKGANQLDGESALAFARERYHLSGGDRQRGINQMAVISAVIGKITSPALLKNYADILNSVADCFETDMPYDTIASLVRRQLDTGTRWNVTSYAVNGTGATKRVYSLSAKAYVMIPDEETVETAKGMMEAVRNGEIPQ